MQCDYLLGIYVMELRVQFNSIQCTNYKSLLIKINNYCLVLCIYNIDGWYRFYTLCNNRK